MVQEAVLTRLTGGTETARSDRSAARRREILHAASSVFRRNGLHATGMRDIAAELGMHAGNLYYYFDSKQALLGFCQVETLAQLRELAARVRNRDLPADRALRQIIRGHIEILNQQIPGSLAHLEVEAVAAEYRPEIVRQRDAYEAEIRQLLARGVSEGTFRPTDVRLASLAILGALNWTVKWYRPDGERTVAEIGESFAQLLVEGLEASGTLRRSDEGADSPPPT